ncbi:alanine racemase [Mesorhizobium retamae]|uniref:Alanine racemase n=1 Tax=Mesorhizobium retamae TaxID=2912854 RepID=A0ABS9QP60_9HYPH|nr:alanine racemase [Mesorhizobium sp. IRAMC:0171]MCG7508491.1 alanine racemase [Mesorhizobium sp. IRAMC:0171]
MTEAATVARYLPLDSAVLEIDLDAVRANYITMGGILGADVITAAVVKSDAYGLGLEPLARTLWAAGCRSFFVANLEEALRLRAVCPFARIAAFHDDYVRFKRIYRLEDILPVINTQEEMDFHFRTAAADPYLLNVDTGFSRLGLSPSEIADFSREDWFLRHPPRILISHLACSDHLSDTMNGVQKQRFEALRRVVKPVASSLVASAGAWLDTSFHYDLARIGSALFGLNNAGVHPNPLRAVLRLKARVLAVREVSALEAVGYGATFRARRNSRIAIVGIGYAQGLPWACAGRISARFGAHSAPVVGRISMEYVTVDVTDVPTELCGPGAWAQFLHDEFGVGDLAAQIGVNEQEIVMRLGSGCLKRYRHDHSEGADLFELAQRSSAPETLGLYHSTGDRAALGGI